VKAGGKAQNKKGLPATGDPPPESVLKPALRLLSTRSRSVREIQDRLLKKELEPSEVSYCVRWLEERDLLNDEAFGRAFTRDRLRFSPRSPFLLKRELRDRGVGPSLAEGVVEAVLEEEETSAQDLAVRAAEAWTRKQNHGTMKALLDGRFTPAREKARRRLYGFLARRGFTGDAARRGLEAGELEARILLNVEEARGFGG
jgi:regulatory protein